MDLLIDLMDPASNILDSPLAPVPWSSSSFSLDQDSWTDNKQHRKTVPAGEFNTFTEKEKDNFYSCFHVTSHHTARSSPPLMPH